MRSIPLLPLFVTACAPAGLSPPHAAQLSEAPEAHGALVYTGQVTPLGHADPLYRYERRVRERPDGTRVSTHLTWQGARPIVLQRATQDAAGRLLAYDEIHGQRQRAYHAGAGPFVVGPTLFELVRTSLPRLRTGAAVPFRFWSQGDTYAFVLTLRGDTVEMRAESWIVRLGIAPIWMKLGANDEVVAYHGRIPPLLDDEPVDADVAYTYAAPFR